MQKAKWLFVLIHDTVFSKKILLQEDKFTSGYFSVISDTKSVDIFIV